MTVPGVGAVVVLSFKSAVDEPGRFRSSNTLGAHFGLTPRRHRKTDITGSISPLEDGPEVAAIHQHAMQHGGQLAGQRHLRAASATLGHLHRPALPGCGTSASA
jgi:transposase IS116/IS110/IS902 family protein